MSINIVRRLWMRNSLIVFFLAVFFIVGIFTGRTAFADPSTPKPSIKSTDMSWTLEKQTRRPVSATTTTTAPKRVVAADKVIVTQHPIVVVEISPQGDWVAQCHQWALQAGIELPPAAISLIDKESDCNPNIQNPTSSACGIAQNIRGCNSQGYGYDPVQQLKWMHGYVFGKFGSWEEALSFWHCIGTCYFKGGSVYKTATWY